QLPDGRTLVTLHDAATYITRLPKKEAAELEWQAANRGIDVGGRTGRPDMFARIGIMKAMNRGRVREFNPSRKDPTGDAASWREIDENSLDLRRYKETGRRP